VGRGAEAPPQILSSSYYVYKQLLQKDVHCRKTRAFWVIPVSSVTHTKIRCAQIYEFGSRYVQQTQS